jgi:hypothetical protein
MARVDMRECRRVRLNSHIADFSQSRGALPSGRFIYRLLVAVCALPVPAFASGRTMTRNAWTAPPSSALKRTVTRAFTLTLPSIFVSLSKTNTRDSSGRDGTLRTTVMESGWLAETVPEKMSFDGEVAFDAGFAAADFVGC